MGYIPWVTKYNPKTKLVKVIKIWWKLNESKIEHNGINEIKMEKALMVIWYQWKIGFPGLF